MTRMHDAERRYRENVASGNLALFAVKSQLDEFLLFRKGLIEEMASRNLRKKLPLWLLVRPSFQTYVGYTIDFKSLGFLFEKPGHGQLFDALHLSQAHYLDLIKLDGFRNSAVSELQRELAKLESANPQDTLQDDQKAVGRYIIAAVESAVVGLAKRATDDEEFYQEAFSKLRMALKKELDVCWLRRQPSLINVTSPLPRFRKESLPDMPEIVVQALATLD